MRLPALVALGFFAVGTLQDVPASAAGRGPAYFEALMSYCYRGGLSDRLGRDPNARTAIGAGARRAALEKLREAKKKGETALTALCASGYYHAIQKGYVTVVQR